MPREKRLINCVVLSCLHKPGVIWRFFRRYYFYQLNRKIERLPDSVRRIDKEYSSFPVD